MTSRSDELVDFFKLRPRDRIYDFVLDRLASLTVRATVECKEPTCGTRDENGEVVSCSSVNCGEKLMMTGWRRELQVMRDLKALVEGIERAAMEREFAEAKQSRGRR